MADAEGTGRGPGDSRALSSARAFRTPLRGHAFAGPTPAEALVAGRAVTLVREPGNPADPHAVSVWLGDDEGQAWRIGYLDRTVAARLAPRLDAGARAEAVLDGWIEEPGGRWERPLIRVEFEAGHADADERTVRAAVWGRPPGVRRRVIER
ncbi:MAG: HIRAN domain-containing protein [Nitriliruptoraceae bacterium]